MVDTINLRACDRAFTVSVDDPDLVEPVRRLFRPYWVKSSGGQQGGLPGMSIRRQAGGHVVEWGVGRRDRCADFSELIIAAEFALTDVLLTACDRWAQLHAAGAVVRGRAALALGGTGAGKSSLALGWSLAGLPLLGDDVLLIDESGQAAPFKRFLKVAPELLEACGVALERTPFWIPGSAEAWFDPLVGGGWGTPVPVHVIALVRYQRGVPLEVEEIDDVSVLNAVLHSLLPTGLDRQRSFDRLVSVIRGARAYRLTFGEARSAAKALADLT